MTHFHSFAIFIILVLQGSNAYSFVKGPRQSDRMNRSWKDLLPSSKGSIVGHNRNRLNAAGGNGGGNGNPPTDTSVITATSIETEEDRGSSALVKLLKKLFDSYNQSLLKHPYLTKIISSAIVGALGDLLIQIWLPYKKGLSPKFDLRRFVVFTAVAGLYIAPVLHVWFNYLNYFPVPANFNRVAKSLVMIFLDQTFGAVVVNAGFFYAFELAQRLVPPYTQPFSITQAFKAGTDSVTRNMWITLVANWYSWPIINFLNFLYVPVQFRLLVSNIAAVFWNMFLSNTANS